MDIAAMIAVVLAGTQFLKGMLKSWGVNIAGPGSVALSLLVTVGIVLYFTLNAQLPITWNAVWLVIQVFFLANGGKQLLSARRQR